MNELISAKINLQPVSEADAAFIEKVYFSTRIDEFGALGWQPAQLESFFKMQLKFQERAFQMQFPKAQKNVIKLENEKVGRMITDSKELELRLVDIAILPEFRGKGIGSFLINNLISESFKENKKVVLQVLKTNTKAFKLYDKLGFTVYSADDMYFSMER